MNFIRNNLFWVLMALAVVAIAALYVFVARDMAEEVESLRRVSRDNINKLRRWANQPTIPNETMIRMAAAEQKSLQVMYGQFFTLFAPRSGFLGQDFGRLAAEKDFTRTDAHEWWKRYERRTKGFLLRVREAFEVPKAGLFSFESTPKSPEPDLAGVKRRQRSYWTLKYAVDALVAASPKEAPLIQKLVAVGEGARISPSLNHPWVRLAPLDIEADMYYKDVPKLIAALQNAPRPLMVSSCTVTPLGDGATAERGRLVRVKLSCELVEFRPAIHAVSFSGPLFKGRKAVGQWLASETRALKQVMAELVAGIPALKKRVEAEVRGPLEDTLRANQKRIRDGAAKNLEERLKLAANGGKLSEEDKAKVEERHKNSIEQQVEKVQEKFDEALRKAVVESDRFDLVYDHLYPLIRHKAYYIGDSRSDRRFVIARPEAGGRWWLGHTGVGATKTGRRALDKAVAPMLAKRLGGRRQRYLAVVVGGRSLSVSDVGFQFGHALHAASHKIGIAPGDAPTTRVEITPAGLLVERGQKTFEVPVKAGTMTGTMTIEVRLRN